MSTVATAWVAAMPDEPRVQELLDVLFDRRAGRERVR
jgi:hypothetical protein